jgi:hypothetical protein
MVQQSAAVRNVAANLHLKPLLARTPFEIMQDFAELCDSNLFATLQIAFYRLATLLL